MILVAGASGVVGGRVLRLLRARGVAAKGMSRSGADGLARADFGDRSSLAGVLTGVRSIFLLTAPPTPSAEHDRTMLAAAAAAGVTRVTRLSAIGTGEAFDGRVVGAWHLAADDATRASGLAWTILRPSSFATNTLSWAAATAPVPNLTGDGRQGVIDPDDIAAVAVETLTAPGHDGQIYTLTGPDLLSVPDQARILTEATGREFRTRAAAAEQTGPDLAQAGMDPAAADAVLLGAAWARAGHNATLTGDVARILGRPPTSFRQWAERHRDNFIER